MEGDFEVTPPPFRSGLSVPKPANMDFQLEEINSLISGSSFTALLELPPTQGMELLIKEDLPAKPMPPPIFPANFALDSRFSIYASADNSLEKRTILSSSSSMKLDSVKQEPLELVSLPNSTSPTLSNQSFKSSKRKERQKKVKEQSKKSKKTVANEGSEVSGDCGEKLPYVHVRARRGQATDSHSLAERARREKINARMKLLQELVPGCDKISGTAMVLDEIINHVQALQCQVEFLSMRLAAVNPRVDLDLVAFLAAENGSSIDTNYPDMFDYPIWLDGHINVNGQSEYHHPLLATKEGTSNFITPDHSLLSYDPLVDFGDDRPNVK